MYYGFSPIIDEVYKGQTIIEHETSQTRVYWTAINEILRSQKPVCSILHELSSTHYPFISNMIRDELLCFSSQRGVTQNQQKYSRFYTDEQLRFYSSLLPKQARRIYFGDHGMTLLGCFHPVLTMIWDGCPSYTVSGLFSYINFSKLLEEIINERVENLQTLCSDYVVIQDIEIYSPVLIEESIQQGDYEPRTGLSYRGVVKNTAAFMRYRDGSVRYWRTSSNRGLFTHEELSSLWELSGGKFLELKDDPEFQHSKRFMKLIQHYKKRTGAYEDRKLSRIRQLFTHEFSEKKIAIRGGGLNTYRFLIWADVCNVIDCVIDIDKNALAEKLGFDILTPQEALLRPIDLLLTLSEKMHAVAQSEPWTCPIMDLLAFGKSEGILTPEHYGYYAITAEDIEASR
jgi:hypothetical protein